MKKPKITEFPPLPDSKKELRFFTFRQNNSYGRFTINDTVGNYVIIEASSQEEANRLATVKTDIYWDDGGDCECCGPRWSELFYDQGSPTPSIYDTPIDEYNSSWIESEVIYIYYYDGRKVRYDFEKNK